MGCVASTCCRRAPDYSRIRGSTHNTTDVPVMRLICTPGKACANYADIGDTVVLFVDFGPDCSPCQLDNNSDTAYHRIDRVRDTAATVMPGSSRNDGYRYEVMIAGYIAELTCLHPAVKDSKCYKASVNIQKEPREGILVYGERIPVRLPYSCTSTGSGPQEKTEKDIEEQYAVYFQAIWDELKKHNSKSVNESSISSRPASMVGYGSMGRTSQAVMSQDQRDGSDQLLSGEQEQKPKRYWPDSWEMHCWKKAGCDSLMRSKNPVARFIGTFFVAPLTNVTGLSLYYQLYLSEIFHTRFWTRLIHYLCMPFIVLMMLAFFAQWRFIVHVNDNDNDISCYKGGNIEVAIILNGSMLLGLVLWFYYLIWGCLQQTTLMGTFMIVPLFILYMLANIFFQVSIQNSINSSHPCDECWQYTSHAGGHIQYYNIFDLMHWYYNPVIWAWVFSLIQSLSHMCEPKIPPRVSQTPHWLSCTQMFKRIGFTKSLCFLSAQVIFGTIDEFIASPRLLPIFVLRVCYELGYHEKQWKWMKKLVKKCKQYGDPALDYIGTGGSEPLSENSVIYTENIDKLKEDVQSMNLALSDHQKELLESPTLLKEYKRNGTRDPFLEHLIILRHYVAQYALQVYAYGPFRMKSNEGEDLQLERQVECDNKRMHSDFEDDHSFIKFLRQVRFSLWQMEDNLIERRWGSCCKTMEETV